MKNKKIDVRVRSQFRSSVSPYGHEADRGWKALGLRLLEGVSDQAVNGIRMLAQEFLGGGAGWGGPAHPIPDFFKSVPGEA
jgi:hypothetical protein